MEHIAGPLHHFFIACYTIEADDGVYGYAKVCEQRPASVWETPGAVAKVVAGPEGNELAAMKAVVRRVDAMLAARYAAQPAVHWPMTVPDYD